jgi:hypothetical protein
LVVLSFGLGKLLIFFFFFSFLYLYIISLHVLSYNKYQKKIFFIIHASLTIKTPSFKASFIHIHGLTLHPQSHSYSLYTATEYGSDMSRFFFFFFFSLSLIFSNHFLLCVSLVNLLFTQLFDRPQLSYPSPKSRS